MGKKYTVNKGFFNKQTPLSCYWAGFISADGCINDSKSLINSNWSKSLKIELAEKDEAHLVRFKRDIEYTGRVAKCNHRAYTYPSGKVRVQKNSYVVEIFSNELCESLERNFKITPRKSLNAIPPEIEDLNNKLSFIAGLIDGDGWLSIYKNGKVEIRLLGTKAMLAWVRDTISQIVPIKGKASIAHPSKNQRVYVLRYVTQQDVSNVFGLLSNLQTIGIPLLDRKWEDKKQELNNILTSKGIT